MPLGLEQHHVQPQGTAPVPDPDAASVAGRSALGPGTISGAAIGTVRGKQRLRAW